MKSTVTYAIILGLVSMGVGAAVANGAGITGMQPVWMFSGALWGAILGGVIGGVKDIVAAIRKDRDDRP